MKAAIATAAALAVAIWSGNARANCDEKKSHQSAKVEKSSSDKQRASLGPSDASYDRSSSSKKSSELGTGGSGSASGSATPGTPDIDYKSPRYDKSSRNGSDGYSLGKRTGDAMRGVTVFAGGGLEGYAGSLSSSIKPGPAWNVTAGVNPTRVLGLELGYTGAANESREQNVGEFARGPDVIRNGANLVATVGLPVAVQPYLLGGVGINHFTVRGDSPGFQSDNAANIPLGAGVRTHIANFTADLRGNYNLGIDEEFASAQGRRSVLGVNTGNAGRYQGMLSLGASF